MTHEQQADLKYLIDQARKVTMSEDEQAAQRTSFAYGNSAFENPNITREMVEQEALKLVGQ